MTPTGYEIDADRPAEGFRCSTCGGLVLAERKGKQPGTYLRAACPCGGLRLIGVPVDEVIAFAPSDPITTSKESHGSAQSH